MAHHNTVFAQMLKFVPRHEFESLAHQYHSGRRLRKMTCWTQFVAMATAQLSGRHSFRDVASNMAAQARKLYQLGMSAVSRSSLSRVNESQPYQLYEALFAKLLTRCQSRAPSSFMLDWIMKVCCQRSWPLPMAKPMTSPPHARYRYPRAVLLSQTGATTIMPGITN